MDSSAGAAGGITAAVEAARKSAPGKPVEVEVENFAELREALVPPKPRRRTRPTRTSCRA